MSTEALAHEDASIGVAVLAPVLARTLPKELEDKFNHLFDEAYGLFNIAESSDDEEDEEDGADQNETEEERLERAYMKRETRLERRGTELCELIKEEVSAHPILAKVMESDILRWSLLMVLCEKSYQTTLGHPAIKFLIEANPHALLWRWSDRYSRETVIFSIANNSCHCVLLPWIAEKFPWVFQHKRCKKKPPHLGLVKNYAEGECPASVVRHFYEHFPLGLLQQENAWMREGLPLQRIMLGWECDADLFIWMAQKAPKAVARRNWLRMNVLHSACMSLSSSVDPDGIAPSQYTENNARICRFLVSEFPQLVRAKGKGGRGLPIHYLARRCNRKLVQEILLLLLKEFPESTEVKAAGFLPKLSDVPFIQEVAPLVKQECGIHQEKEWLRLAAANLMICTRSLEVAEVGVVFGAWVAQRTSDTLLKSIQDQISGIRHSFEGDDVDRIADEDDDAGEEPFISEDDSSENEEGDKDDDSSSDDDSTSW